MTETLPLGKPAIAGYRLTECIGHGGMGEVWEAERADGQFEQRVAIKLLKRGLDSEDILGRFRLERQILANLEHPGITRLLDGGLAVDGRPYLVMELVQGQAITDHVFARQLDLRARLELFVEVCAAVTAAHQALVVHRDLKPSNILVTANGRPKLLDFGIAKLLDGPSDASQTRLAEPPITPAYAAPEQFLGQAITTATDVYALGVVLYEMLTGRRPSRRQARSSSTRTGDLDVSPVVKPSEAAKEEAAGGLPAAQLDREIDAIVLRALREEPSRRYASVAEFAADLGHYLAGRPVLARGDHFSYLAAKFLRRHRLAAISGTLVAAAILVGSGLALSQALRAQREAEHAQEVERYLIEIFEKADPSQGLGERLSARQLLDEGARRLGDELAQRPVSRARLQDALARSYRGIGAYPQAKTLAEAALADLQEVGEPLMRERVRLTLVEIAASAGDLVGARAHLAPAMVWLEQNEPGSLDQARALAALSSVALQEGDAEAALAAELQAQQIVRQELGDASSETCERLQAVASVYGALGRLDEGVAALEQALERHEAAGRGASPQAAFAHTALADLYDTRGEAVAAEKHFTLALALQQRAYGDQHPEIAQTLLKYGFFLIQRKRFDLAEASLRQAVAILEPLDHYDVAAGWRYLGYSALGRERFAEALPYFEAAEQFFRRRLGNDHPLTWAAVVALAQAKLKVGQLEDSAAMNRAAIAALVRLHGEESNEIRAPMKNLGEALRRLGQVEEALAWHRRVLAIERKLFGKDEHLGVAVTQRQLALDLLARGDAASLAEAEVLLAAAIRFVEGSESERARLPEFLVSRAELHLARQNRRAAQVDLRSALALWETQAEMAPVSTAAARALLAQLEQP